MEGREARVLGLSTGLSRQYDSLLEGTHNMCVLEIPTNENIR